MDYMQLYSNTLTKNGTVILIAEYELGERKTQFEGTGSTVQS